MIDNIAGLFRDELDPGEMILWTGQPQQGLLFRQADILLVPFSLIWGGFVIFWENGVVSSGAPFFFGLFGLPFILFALYLVAGRFFVDAMQREKTFYALTTERVMILSGLFNQNVRALYLKTLSEVSISTSSDGRGTITFGPPNPMTWLYSGGWWPGMYRYQPAPSFERIDGAKKVHQLLKRVQRELIGVDRAK